MKRVFFVSSLLFLGFACTPTRSSESTSRATVTYHGDIKPLVEARCAGCHAEGEVAFSLTDYGSVRDKGDRVVEAIEKRRMPVWLAAAGHETYAGDPTITDAELGLFRSWRDEGFPEGDAGTTPPPAAGGLTLTDLDADVALPLLPGEQTYLPRQELVDDYRCFVLDWPLAETKYMTGFQAIPGNREVVHHLVAYKVDAALVPMLRAMDDDEEGGGYQCFGGAMPDRIASKDVQARIARDFPEAAKRLGRHNSQWLGHWAPGMKGNHLPEGTGLPMAARGAVVVQVHYYTRTAPNSADKGTEVRFTLADSVAKPGFVLPMTNDEWLPGPGFEPTLVVPAGGSTTVTHSVSLARALQYGQAVFGYDPAAYKAIEVHSANLHMHSYGTSAKTWLRHAGEDDVLLAIDDWDLAWQRDFTFVTPKVFRVAMAKDVAYHLECSYENKTAKTVLGGLGSDDEMCFNFTFIALAP